MGQQFFQPQQQPQYSAASNLLNGGQPVTKKDKVLSLLFGPTIVGNAIRGGIAAVGAPSMGVGFQTGLQLPILQQQQADATFRRGLENQILQAQAARLPMEEQALAAQLDRTTAEAEESRARANALAHPAPPKRNELDIATGAAAGNPADKAVWDLMHPTPPTTPVPGRDVPFPADVEEQRKRMAAAGRPNINNFTRDDAQAIADAIEAGDQPPTIQGLYRNAAPVRAELARRGVPLAKMEMDWKATQKFLSTLNGPQQLRMQQSINSAGEMLDKIETLYGEWKQLAPTSGYKVVNKAALSAMKNLPGRAGAVAQALDTQIADLTADLGNVYMGGNTPTDQALKLAEKNLSADWNQETFEEGLRQARANVHIRANSMRHSLPSGVSGQYYPVPNQAEPQQGGSDDPLAILPKRR